MAGVYQAQCFESGEFGQGSDPREAAKACIKATVDNAADAVRRGNVPFTEERMFGKEQRWWKAGNQNMTMISIDPVEFRSELALRWAEVHYL